MSPEKVITFKLISIIQFNFIIACIIWSFALSECCLNFVQKLKKKLVSEAPTNSLGDYSLFARLLSSSSPSPHLQFTLECSFYSF